MSHEFHPLVHDKPGLIFSLLFAQPLKEQPLKEQIGLRLNWERKSLGLTVKQLADVCGVGKNTVVDWQAGQSSPTAERLALLAKAGVDVMYVITGKKTPGESK